MPESAPWTSRSSTPSRSDRRLPVRRSWRYHGLGDRPYHRSSHVRRRLPGSSCRLPESHVWRLERIRGSHPIYAGEGEVERISVPVHGSADLKRGLQAHLMKIAQIAESGVIDYSNFRSSLKRLEEQHDNHQTLAAAEPQLTREGIAESVIQRFETCYDCLWKVLKRYLMEGLGIAEPPYSPKPVFRLANETSSCLRRLSNGCGMRMPALPLLRITMARRPKRVWISCRNS